jgi:molybdate transport system substrate-binding protein
MTHRRHLDQLSFSDIVPALGGPMRVRSVLLTLAALAASIVTIAAAPIIARAADIRFLCAGALESTVEDVVSEFQKATGYNVKAEFAAIGVITRRLRNGDAADLAIVSPRQWEDLAKEGKVDPAIRVIVARVGAGVFVKKGAAKPDISSVDAFKRTLLNAKSVALSDPAGGGPVGIYATGLFERLGISADVKPKLRLVGGGLAPVEPVAKGEAEIGLSTISEILPAPGVELVGPLPAEIQSFIVYTGAIPGTAKEPAAAKALLDFLISPRVTPVLKSKGLERG